MQSSPRTARKAGRVRRCRRPRRHAAQPDPRRRLFARPLPARLRRRPEAVLVNTAGGIAGGDRFAIDLDLGPGARLIVTTASAEKVYRSLGPTSPHRRDGAARRRRRTDLAAPGDHPVRSRAACPPRRYRAGAEREARLCRDRVFGRSAMGEIVARGPFSDCWRMRRDGRLVFAENFRLDGANRRSASARPPSLPATWRSARCCWCRAKRPMVAAMRAAAADSAARLGISAWNGIALARLPRPTARRCGTICPCAARAWPRRLAAPVAQLSDQHPAIVAAMHLTPREKDKLMIAMAAMVARRRLDRGVKLNHPKRWH